MRDRGPSASILNGRDYAPLLLPACVITGERARDMTTSRGLLLGDRWLSMESILFTEQICSRYRACSIQNQGNDRLRIHFTIATKWGWMISNKNRTFSAIRKATFFKYRRVSEVSITFGPCFKQTSEGIARHPPIK